MSFVGSDVLVALKIYQEELYFLYDIILYGKKKEVCTSMEKSSIQPVFVGGLIVLVLLSVISFWLNATTGNKEISVLGVITGCFALYLFLLLRSVQKEKNRIIEKKGAELELYREFYHRAYERMPESFKKKEEHYRVSLILGIVLFLIGFIALFYRTLYYGNFMRFLKIDNQAISTIFFDVFVPLITIIMMVIGLIMMLKRFFYKDSDEAREEFVKLLLYQIDPKYQYGIDEKKSTIQEECKDVFDNDYGNVVGKIKTPFAKFLCMEKSVVGGISGHYMRRWLDYFLIIIPFDFSAEDNDAIVQKIKDHLEEFQNEYAISFRMQVKNQKIYLLSNESVSFFPTGAILKRKIDEWSLYYLYCIIKIAKDLSKNI